MKKKRKYYIWISMANHSHDRGTNLRFHPEITKCKHLFAHVRNPAKFKTSWNNFLSFNNDNYILIVWMYFMNGCMQRESGLRWMSTEQQKKEKNISSRVVKPTTRQKSDCGEERIVPSWRGCFAAPIRRQLLRPSH